MLSISNAIIYFWMYELIKEKVLDKNKIFNSYYVLGAATLCKSTLNLKLSYFFNDYLSFDRDPYHFS